MNTTNLITTSLNVCIIEFRLTIFYLVPLVLLVAFASGCRRYRRSPQNKTARRMTRGKGKLGEMLELENVDEKAGTNVQMSVDVVCVWVVSVWVGECCLMKKGSDKR